MATPWGAIILAVLQLANYLLGRVQNQKLIDQGYEKRIAEEAATILKGNQYAKQVMASINGFDDDATDKLLQSLEPKQRS